MKKNIYNSLFVFLVVLGIAGCEKEYEAPNDASFSDAVATMSGNTIIQRGDFTSFADLSKGVTKRNWTIPGSASIINLDGMDPSEMKLIHVKFEEPGDYVVRLQSEFLAESVRLDTNFAVTVYDYIQADIEIVSIEAGFYEQTPTQIKMYEGGTITFQDVSLGNPNRRAWSFEGGDPSMAGGISVEDDAEFVTVDVSYANIGVYDLQLISWRQYPDGDPDTLLLENYINVIENLDPPTLKSIEEDNDGVIHLTYDLPLKASGDLVSNFTLNVDGGAAVISSVAINAANNRIVDVTPAENISGNSTATLSYDGNGELSRINDIAVQAFTDEEITLFIQPNVASDLIYGFEDGGNGWNTNVVWPWDNKGLITFTNTKAASGDYSMKLEATADEICRAYSRKAGSLFTLEAGKSYTIEYKVWIDPSYTDGSIFPEVIHNTTWVPTGFWTDLSSISRSEWVTVNKETEKTFTPAETGEYFMSFRFEKKGVIYIDDIKIYEVE